VIRLDAKLSPAFPMDSITDLFEEFMQNLGQHITLTAKLHANGHVETTTPIAGPGWTFILSQKLHHVALLSILLPNPEARDIRIEFSAMMVGASHFTCSASPADIHLKNHFFHPSPL
jgi:hypothetical protein